MKRLSWMALAILGLVACKKGADGNSEEKKMQIVSAETDSTKYGIAIRMKGDSLFWLTEHGDSLWSDTHTALMLGTMEAEHRLAVLFENGNNRKAKNVIDLSDLVGRWVEPDPVNEGMAQGVELQEGGTAISINSRATNYVSWRLYNGKLLLVNSYEGYVDDNEKEDTFYITRLTTDSMIVTTSYNKHFYRKSNSESEDVIRDYNIDDILESKAFDPEGEAPQGSEGQEIPEYDRIF